MRMDSRELSEWQAYERAVGPIGRQYADDMLASIHEQLQFLSYLTGAQYGENPAPEPQRVPRPNEIFVEPAEESSNEEGFAELDRWFQ